MKTIRLTTLNRKCMVVKDNKVTVDVEDVKTGVSLMKS